MFSLMRYAKKYKKEIILGPIFKFMEAVFELLLPIFMARLIDQGIKGNNEPYVIKTAGTMVLMSVIGLLCVVICQYFSSVASQGFGTELRNALMKKINELSHKELNDFGTATLITRMTGDINQLQLALAMLIRLVIRAPFLSIGSIVMAFYIQPKMSMIFIIALPVFCLILYFIMKKTIPLYIKVQQKIDHFNRVLQENLSGVRVIRAFAQKKPKIEKFGEVSDELAFAYTNVANISAILNPATTLIMNGSVIALLYFGGIHVNTGSMQQGEVLALINYMIQMLLALIVVANLVIIFTRASASATRVEEILAIHPSIQSPKEPIEAVNAEKNTPLLTFENVDFKYNKDSGLAIESIDFELHSEEMLGIIGPTGSGKSTILELIPRFYDTTSGIISWCGTDIRKIPLHVLRENIAVVPQKSVLFSGTIRENLQWGKKGATDEECWDALATAQCLSFVKSLPEQLDAPVLANGKNLSGGQKQRLAIARAVIKKPKLLLLDDSLSALDYRTDSDLRQALRTDLKGTGIIIVSQRISSIQQADQILVMDEGKQIALGTHEELLKISNVYRNIYHLQVEKEV